jgi:hypothetical protein
MPRKSAQSSPAATKKPAPRRRAAAISETDLYAPIAEHLLAQGYTVRSEVQHCDITAVKGEELVVIELKRNFSTALLVQAVKRQRVTDSVYVAIPRPKWSRAWNGVKQLLRRLELGLILVSLDTKTPRVEIAFHPAPHARRKQPRRTRAILREIEHRSGDFNQGGSLRRKLVTAYRERALFVACCLERFGPLSARKLREIGTAPDTYSILFRDVYHWFERVAPGTYDLRPQGRIEIDLYRELVERHREQLEAAELPGAVAPEEAKPRKPRSRRTRRGAPQQEKEAAGPN